jgi:hypothetical protein
VNRLRADAEAPEDPRLDLEVNRFPYLLPWVRVLFLIPSIRSTTSGHEAWPQIKPILRRALEFRRQIARDGWWNQTCR